MTCPLCGSHRVYPLVERAGLTEGRECHACGYSWRFGVDSQIEVCEGGYE